VEASPRRGVFHHWRNRSSVSGDSMTLRSLRPLDCFSLTTSGAQAAAIGETKQHAHLRSAQIPVGIGGTPDTVPIAPYSIATDPDRTLIPPNIFHSTAPQFLPRVAFKQLQRCNDAKMEWPSRMAPCP
jgi:hypothetical protein